MPGRTILVRITPDETFSPDMIGEQLAYAESLGLGVADLSAVKIVEVTA